LDWWKEQKPPRVHFNLYNKPNLTHFFNQLP
jgi:hypothetical protein